VFRPISQFAGEESESDARLKLALSASRMGIWELHVPSKRLFWSDECFGIVAMPPSQGLTIETFNNLVHRDDLERVTSLVEEAVASGNPFVAEFRFHCGDGQTRWLANCGQAQYNRLGEPVRLIGTVQDITHSRQIADDLRASERRFRQIADNITEVFWLTDVSKTEIVYVSPGFESIWGMQVGDLHTDPRLWLSAIHPDDRERVAKAALSQASGGYDEEYRIVRADGTTRWIRDRAFPVRDDHGAVVRIAGIAEDMTVRRNLEHQIRQQQKMTSLGALASGIAHDFNNLLTVISAYTEMVDEVLAADSPVREFISEIRQASADGSALTRQLQAFLRDDVTEPVVLDINPVIQSTLRMLKPLLGKRIASFARLGSTGKVKVRQDQLSQVLMNLAVNARDAMPDGGRLDFETSDVLIRDHSASLPAGAYVQIAVTDTGVGIPAETVAQIFEPFFTTKDAQHGTGLGLAVVSSILQQNNAFIEVTSSPGHGTTFTVSLPVVTSEPPN